MQKLQIRPSLPAKPKSEEIMDLAECLARTSGYNGFSFRDLAEAANVKSASIHYHFPTKEDLGAAIARRYASRVYARLGDPSAGRVRDNMEAFIDIFRSAITEDGRLCLFLVFGSELLILPEKVQIEVREFFNTSVDWLVTLLRRYDEFSADGGKDPVSAARTIIAALDGAMVGCRVFADLAVFEAVVLELKSKGLIPTPPLSDAADESRDADRLYATN